jgi:hypothetical protein
MTRSTIRLIIPAAGMCLVASCSSPNRPAGDAARPAESPHAAVTPAPTAATTSRGTGTSPATGPHVLGEHWVQDWRIRAIMQRVAIGENPNWPRGAQHDPERPPTTAQARQNLADAAALADGLAAAAAQLPAIVANRPMADEDRQDFTARAMALRQQSLDLKQQALAGQVEQAQRTLNAINTTCFDCHVRHRDLSGVLEGGRAASDRPYGAWTSPRPRTADARAPAAERP